MVCAPVMCKRKSAVLSYVGNMHLNDKISGSRNDIFFLKMHFCIAPESSQKYT